jgi:predicted phosphodiesterase
VRYLILSDIHGNWEGLEAVLAHSRGQCDEILCLGDLVGYCADPNRVVDWARENVKQIVRGNHDRVCAGLEDLYWFNPVARHAALWTRNVLTEENRQFLIDLPRGPLAYDSCLLVHGSPLDEDEYLLSRADVHSLDGYVDVSPVFFGHSHLQGVFQRHRNGVLQLNAPSREEDAVAIEMEPDSLYFINPGSVGQPRDRDARAGFALYEPEARLVTLHRVSYDVESAQKKIIEAHLPPMLAERLRYGS